MRKLKRLGCLFLVAFAVGGAGALWVFQGIRPMPGGEPLYVRFESTTPIASVLETLKQKGVVREPLALRVYGFLYGKAKSVGAGTYKVKPGMTADELFVALGKSVRQMVRIPETNWAARTANILERHGVCTAAAYMELFRKPQEFQSEVGFPLPKVGTLEGYLYPDTYDLPPELGARAVIQRQLRAFEEKVWEPMNKPKDLHRLLTIGSLVELEVLLDEERPVVAGVIENRIEKKMRLEIDATVLYALGEWKALTRKEIRETDSPYNTYRVSGLPPGPICSPTVKSIRAAMNPAEHPYFYYVALPEGKHLFSESYEGHLANFRKRKEALALQNP
jgi:UPF0755 protein